MGWAGRYIGIPFLSKGRDLKGLDCAGLVLMVYERELEIDLPDTISDLNYDADDVAYSGEAINKHRHLFDQVKAPKTFDLVLFKRCGVPSHLGIMLDKMNFMHSVKRAGVCIERVESPRWHRRLEGFYRCRT